MKKILILTLTGIWFIACNTNKPAQAMETKPEQMLTGEWDNFQQVWLQNTDTEMHRVATTEKHRHYHLSITQDTVNSGELVMSVHGGRNGKNFIEKQLFNKEEWLNSEAVTLKGDTLYIEGLKHFSNVDSPYKFIRARSFSGWLQYPMEQYGDSVYFKPGLKIHDQGGMAELDIDGVDYTVELTQLVYGKRIKLMKIAIYDMPMDSVDINSKSVSYAWTSPKATRLGINLRKIVSGWTLVEPEETSDNDKQKK